MKLLRADLRSRDDALTLLELRNLDSSRLWTGDPDAVIDTDRRLAHVAARTGTTPAEDSAIAWFVVDGDDGIVGYQRFDVDGDDPTTWTVSTALRPAARGRGLGTRSTTAAIDRLRAVLARANRPLHRLHAWIHTDNTPSIRMFSRCGFARTGRTTRDGTDRTMELHELPSSGA